MIEFNLSIEDLSQVRLYLWNAIFVGLQQVSAIAYHRQLIDLVWWEGLGSLDQPAKYRLMIDPKNQAKGWYPNLLGIELTVLLFSGWTYTS